MGQKWCAGPVQTFGQPLRVSNLISDEGTTLSGPGRQLRLFPKASSKVMHCWEHRYDDLNELNKNSSVSKM